MKAYLHGENFLSPVTKLPTGKIEQLKKVIVGHSESGHHHVLESGTAMDVVNEVNGLTFIGVKTPAKLKHLKTFDIHETLTVEPGVYQVTHKTEYDPFQKVLRRVFD